MLKKVLVSLAALAAMALIFLASPAYAEETDCSVSVSDGTSSENLLDDNYRTKNTYAGGVTFTVTSDTEISGIYIKWDDDPGQWTLTVNGEEYTYGTEGYLHEYVALPEAAYEVTIKLGGGGACITDIYTFDDGQLPDWVQIWDESYEEADILIFSSHADDEILFMGSIITTYIDAGYRVQVAYFCDFYQTEPYRRHELLDGLWTMGVTHYPQLGEFEDIYSTSLEAAQSQYDLDEALEYIVETIRRFKPLVLVSQDLDGEYGHGTHMLVANLITQAIEITADEDSYPESAEKYGTWDVPKTYLHLYEENTIEIDGRVPLESFGGLTALEVCEEAYLCHKSQQWMWFYVSDGYDDDGNETDYEYSFAKFGLYRSLVGEDTGNDIMENVTSYDEQEAIAEAESIAESESIAAEEASIAEAESIAAEEASKAEQNRKLYMAVAAIVIIILIVLIIQRIVMSGRKGKNRKHR